MLQKWSCNFQKNCQGYLWTLTNCPVRSITLDNARKRRPKSFLHWKVCFFFQKFVFQQPLRCYRNDLVTCTVFGRIPCRPLQIVPWDFSQSILWKKEAKVFYLLEVLPFFQNFVSSTTSWVLHKWSCNFRNCQNILWTVINCPLRFVTLDNARKNRSKSFLRSENALFFRNFCLQQHLRS